MEENAEIDDVKNTLLNNAKFIKEIYNEDFDGDDEVKSLVNESMKIRLDHIANLIHLKSKNTTCIDDLQTAKKSCRTVNDFENEFANIFTEAKNKRIKVRNTAEYQNAKKLLENINEEPTTSRAKMNNDDDIVEMIDSGDDVFSLYDPWSKTLLRNPVKNSICGHIYERDSVYAVITDNIQIRCPILGCTNEHYISPNHIVVDREVCNKVSERLANAAINNKDDESDNEC